MITSGLVIMIEPMNQGLIGLMARIQVHTRTGGGMNLITSRIMKTVQSCSSLMACGMMMIVKSCMLSFVK